MCALLSEAGMLVSLQGKTWGARLLDRTVTEDVLAAKKATSDSGGFSKALLPGNDALKEIRAVLGKARNEHYRMSAPWGEVGKSPSKGARIITTKMHADHAKMIEGVKDEFNPLVKKFIKGYTKHKAAAKVKLGDLYQDTDYPSPSELTDFFQLDVQYEPVPDPTTVDDWRLTMPANEMAKIKKEMTARNDSAVLNVQKDLYDRLHKAVDHMSTKLHDPKSKFHKTLVTNIEEVSDVVQKLNITDDEILNSVAKQATETLTKHTAAELKADPSLREKVASAATEQAGEIAGQMAGLMGDKT